MQLPQEFLSELAGYGTSVFDKLPEALCLDPSVSVRFNRAKGFAPKSDADCVDWCPQGCYLPTRPAFTFHVPLHQGAYYVQDASSMFLWHVIEALTADKRPIRYLDACAAPGGKATVALDVLPKGSVVVANEFVPQRAAVLRENLIKWGNPLHVVTQGDTSRFRSTPAVFDIIAADVPCSGEGMMRKDAQAVEQWSPSLVKQCVARQQEIVSNLWEALVPGGYFIYSTCTFNRLENELMVQSIIEKYGAEPVKIPTNPDWGICDAVNSDLPCYRFIPGRIRGEGLFMAVLRKPVGAIASTAHRGHNEKSRRQSNRAVQAVVEKWIDEGEVVCDGDSVKVAVPILFTDFPYRPLIEVATIKGKDVVPTQALALSALLRDDAFQRVDVDALQALAYLRGETILLPSDAPRGIVLLTYASRHLGFVKNLGSRANNLYPKAWRILSNRPPEVETDALLGI